MYRPEMEDMEELFTEAQSHWLLQNATCRKAGSGVYRIDNGTEAFVLKRITFPLSEYAYIQGAVRHLHARGFHHVPVPVVTQEGTDYLYHKEFYYFLAPWLPGDQADYHNIADVKTAGRTMALLHEASSGYRPYYYKGRIKWGELPDTFNRKIRDMESFAQRARAKSLPGLFDVLYRRQVEQALTDARVAGQGLPLSYGQVNALEERRGGFCHHDFAAQNLLITGEEVANVIDFDYCISDCACHDVASLLLRILKRNAWQLDAAMSGFLAYQEVCSLSAAEKSLIYHFMLFPQDFWQAGFAYYVEGWVPREKLERRLDLWQENMESRRMALEHLRREWRLVC